MTRSILILACLAAAACSNRVASPSPLPPSSSTNCVATNAQFAVGERATADLLERARNAAQARTARYLRPNEAITMEYNGSRLNLGLNERDIVASVNCG